MKRYKALHSRFIRDNALRTGAAPWRSGGITDISMRRERYRRRHKSRRKAHAYKHVSARIIAWRARKRSPRLSSSASLFLPLTIVGRRPRVVQDAVCNSSVFQHIRLGYSINNIQLRAAGSRGSKAREIDFIIRWRFNRSLMTE